MEIMLTRQAKQRFELAIDSSKGVENCKPFFLQCEFTLGWNGNIYIYCLHKTMMNQANFVHNVYFSSMKQCSDPHITITFDSAEVIISTQNVGIYQSKLGKSLQTLRAFFQKPPVSMWENKLCGLYKMRSSIGYNLSALHPFRGRFSI